MPYILSNEITSIEDLLIYSVNDFKENRNIDVKIRHQVLRINHSKRTVTIHEKEKNTDFEIAYGKLVITTGATPQLPPFFQSERHGIFVLRHLNHLMHMNQFLVESSPQTAFILGGGYLGVELADVLHARGLSIHIIEKSERLLQGFDPEFSNLALESLKRHGVEVDLNHTIASTDYDRGYLTSLTLDDMRRFHSTFLIACIGVNPASELAREAGIRTGSSGAILTDNRMQTVHSDIFAAGDCCEMFHAGKHQPVFMPLGIVANTQGRIAGENAAGGNAVFNGSYAPTAIRLFDIGFALTGLTDSEAETSGIPYISTVTQAKTDGMHSSGEPMVHIKLTAQKNSHVLLGAQIAGPRSYLKRIDILTIALIKHLTIEQLSEIDFLYTPTVSSYPDPIALAARALVKRR
jgi:NADPH-dependent 2,4-dienoyl-CoA reductase/sulfur reductase-like enzyme